MDNKVEIFLMGLAEERNIPTQHGYLTELFKMVGSNIGITNRAIFSKWIYQEYIPKLKIDKLKKLNLSPDLIELLNDCERKPDIRKVHEKLRKRSEVKAAKRINTQIDTGLLSDCIIAVEKVLADIKKTWSPEKKARFIALQYEYYLDTGKKVTHKEVFNRLKLVA